MKKLILILVLFIFTLSSIRAQITQAIGDLLITDTLETTPLHPWIDIPNPTLNLWQVGIPQKPFFNAAYQNGIPILTDALNFYPTSIDEYFQITIPEYDSLYGEVILSFYHKYDTDSLMDGGIIDVSNDGGTTWINIKDDINHFDHNFINIPQDTIKGGEYGFSGRSEGWQYCELYWLYIIGVKDRESPFNPIIRFRLKSDEINTNKEGWMIDHIIFRGYEMMGSVNDLSKNKIKVYPNPTNDVIHFSSSSTSLNGFQFYLFDITGKIILLSEISDNELINIQHLKSGIYFYKLQKENEVLTGKLVRE